ncbi:MAG TPA: VWA domain-containing protein [Bryobacteraceae bacterium]|jgi:VWFA-related protein
MNRRSLLRKLAGVGAGSFLFPRLQAGDDPRDFVLHSEAKLVLLDVSVRDREGALVSGLSQDNFHVFENGRPQPLTVFDHDDLPVTLGILVDESRSMTPKRADVISAALAFIADSNHNDEIFVLNFNETVKHGLPAATPFSDDPEELHKALARALPQGRTALYDAVVEGLRHLEQGKRAKKTLVLISDGGDNASKHTRRETLDLVERSIATIYTIGVFDAEDKDRDPGILRHLAEISGGEAYFPESSRDMLPVCHRIAKDIRARYTLGYPPPEGSDGHARALRHIEIHVSAPGYHKLITRTRESYVYEEASK